MREQRIVSVRLDTVVRQSGGQASAEVGNDIALMDIQSGSYYYLNALGARIWQMLEEPQRISDVCDALADLYDVERDRLEDDVTSLVSQLVDKSLAAVIDEAAD